MPSTKVAGPSVDEHEHADHKLEHMTSHAAEQTGQDEFEIEQSGGDQVLFATDSNIDQAPDGSHRKLTKDRRIILIPKPSDNPEDPLNWSSLKKHTLLLLVAFGAFSGDFAALAGIPAILAQAEEWHISPTRANYPNNLASIMCGVSGLIWMPLINSWGRIPVLFWSCFFGVMFTLGCVLAPTYTTYYAMRGIQCVNQSTGQTIGLAFVEDIFFYHQYARKIGIWYTLFLCAPFFSPMVGNFMLAKLGDWRPMFWLSFACSTTLLACIFFFGDETYYNRSIPPERQKRRPQSQRILRVLGIWQLTDRAGYFPTVVASYRRLFEVLFKPVIPMTMAFYSIIFMWSLGITTSSSILLSLPVIAGGYGLNTLTLAYTFFTPLAAVFLGEAFGHFFNDFVAKRYALKHSGRFTPEVRFITTYLGGVLMIPGLIIFGQALHKHLSIGAIIISWGMYTIGTMVTSVAIVTYAVECYPSASGEVSALINFGRVACGFTVPYFQLQWGLSEGFDVTFGIQAGIVAGSFMLAATIQYFGPRLRRKAGPVSRLIP